MGWLPPAIPQASASIRGRRKGESNLLLNLQTALVLDRSHYRSPRGSIQHLLLDLAVDGTGVDEHCSHQHSFTPTEVATDPTGLPQRLRTHLPQISLSPPAFHPSPSSQNARLNTKNENRGALSAMTRVKSRMAEVLAPASSMVSFSISIACAPFAIAHFHRSRRHTSCTKFTKPPDLMLLRASSASSLKGRDMPLLDIFGGGEGYWWCVIVRLVSSGVRVPSRNRERRLSLAGAGKFMAYCNCARQGAIALYGGQLLPSSSDSIFEVSRWPWTQDISKYWDSSTTMDSRLLFAIVLPGC